MANGKFAGGDGSKDNPFLIEDAFDLDSVRNGLDKHYKLIKDIDLDIAPFNEGQGWIPIGNPNTKPLTGNFDGNNKKIKNLYINRPNCTYQGLFGQSQNTTISNINMFNVNISTSDRGGAIVGEAYDYTNIFNCSVTQINANFTKMYTGGLCGMASTGCNIKNCYINGGSMNFKNEVSTGGLTGFINFNCTVINCSVICDLIVSKPIGGLIGGADGKESIVKNCFCIGKNMLGIQTSKSSNGNLPIVNCFWNKDFVTLISNSGKAKTTEELKTSSTYIDWDKEKLEDGSPVWIFKDGEYPKLWFEKSPYKYLLESNNTYYSFIEGDFQTLGTPQNNEELENWYEQFGEENVNILFRKIKQKVVKMIKSNNEYKTIHDINFKELIENVEFKLIENDESKNLTYTIDEITLLNEIFNKISNDFNICQYVKKESI